MSLSKSKCWYSNNWLNFLKRAVTILRYHVVGVNASLAEEMDLRPIYTRVRFRIRLVCVFKKAGKFCSYVRANLMQNRPQKSDV
jgi:hypothetical protein